MLLVGLLVVGHAETLGAAHMPTHPSCPIYMMASENLTLSSEFTHALAPLLIVSQLAL